MNKSIAIHRAIAPSNINSPQIQYQYQQFAQQLDLQLVADVFIDSHRQDSRWAFKRQTDRLALLKAVEFDANIIICSADFFTAIGQTAQFAQQLVIRALRRLGFDLKATQEFQSESYYPVEEDGLQVVRQYEGLYNTIHKLRARVRNEKKGIKTLDGKGKVSGRKTILEKHPDLGQKLTSLYRLGYSQREIGDRLAEVGIKNSKGNTFNNAQIGRMLKQLNLI